MEESIPPKLYKYQPVALNPYTVENIRKGHIRFSLPEELNDPFDCSIRFRIHGTDDDFLKFFKVTMEDLRNMGKSDEISHNESIYLTDGKPNKKFKKDVYKTLREKDQERVKEFSQMRVACFSESLDSILMWSHYADGHRGLCLEFDTKYFPFHNQQGLHRVIYRSSYPVLSPIDLFESPTELNNPLITKAKSWKYEQEWRLILNEKGDPLQEYDQRALTGIYFGCSMADVDKRKIAAIPAKSAARLFCMKPFNSKFRLEFVPYVD